MFDWWKSAGQNVPGTEKGPVVDAETIGNGRDGYRNVGEPGAFG